MGIVTVPAEFFRAELRVYGDWREAFARELVQNATDASPTRIDITFEDLPGCGRVTFSDDGVGMTRQVLEDVFFALGRTTKTDGDSIGGFGRARIILCFAQAGYTIHTGNLLVTGKGGEYTITEVPEHHRGAKFTIDLLDDDTSRVASAFDRFLSSCTLTVPVHINGYAQPGKALPKRAMRVLRDSDERAWGKVYVTENRYSGSALVRVNGLTMFRRWIGGDDDVVLELDPRQSREVLAASRDQLRGEYLTAFDEFIADLSRNRRRALRPPAEPLDLRVGGGGFMVSDAESKPEENPSGDAPCEAAEARPAREDGESGGTMVRVTPANEAAYNNFAKAPADQLDLMDLLASMAAEPVKPRLGFDVYLLAGENDTRVRKLARTWDPSGWTGTTGQRRRALLLAWKAAVSVALDTLLARHPELGRVMWTVGWTFDEDAIAVHRSSGDGHVLALNPVTADGKSRYKVSSRADRRDLLASALHEVAHIAHPDHDERFASVLTSLFAQTDPVEADRRIREAASR